MPWLLDVIFTLEGTGTFERIETACAQFDSMRPDPVLLPVIESWGDELHLLRH
jgi:hypothetical protein